MSKNPAKKPPATTTIRFNEADEDLIVKLKGKLGVTATAEVIRMGLRALAEKQGIKL